MSTAKVFTVFLASASDVLDERDAAERVVSKVNQKLAALGWMVRLVRWENVRRGLGAPQRRINPELDECDLLVGVVHLAWGTETEDYSSGFEEEFERVRRRHDQGESVDAVLFLREIGEDEVADESTLAFRDRARALALLYEYATIDQFTGQLFEHLAEEVVRRAASQVSVREPEQGTRELLPGPSPAGELAARTEGSAPASREEDGSEHEAAAALRRLAEAITRNEEPPSEEKILRAHLAATAMLSQQVSEAVLDSHQANALYRHRDDFELGWPEQRLLYRSMCEYGLLIPGWRMLPRERGIVDLLLAAATDSSATVRRGALRELGASGLRDAAHELTGPVDTLDVLDVYLQLSRDEDSSVRDLVARFLPASGLGETDLLLGLIVASGGSRAARILIERLIPMDPSAACWLVADFASALDDDVKDRLVERAQDIDQESLEELEGSGRAGWALALRIRARSGRLDDSLARSLDGKLAVRSAAVAALIEVDVELSPSLVVRLLASDDRSTALGALGRDDALLLRALEKVPGSVLLEYVDWLSTETAVALHAAARRSDNGEALARARGILGDGLKREREQAIERYVAGSREPEEALRSAHRLADRFGDFLDATLVSAALSAIAEHPDPAVDADLARAHVDGEYGLPAAAARVLALCGDPKDLVYLVQRSDKVFRADLDELLAGALRAAGEDVDRVLDVIRDELENASAQVAALLRLARARDLRVRDETLLELLYDESDQVRLAAGRLLVATRDSKDLVPVLEHYADSDRYRYYNVVGLLDRVLYGPFCVAAQAMSAEFDD